MLFIFELLLAIIIVAVRYCLKNKDKYFLKVKRVSLKVAAVILATLLTLTIIIQVALERLLYKISNNEKRLKIQDK